MTTSSEDAFKLLPKELAELILSDLEPEDLARSSGVNHYWRKLASNDLLWRKFFNDYQKFSEPLKIVYEVSVQLKFLQSKNERNLYKFITAYYIYHC